MSISFAEEVVAAEVMKRNRNCAYGVTIAICRKYDSTLFLYALQLPSMMTLKMAQFQFLSLSVFSSLCTLGSFR